MALDVASFVARFPEFEEISEVSEGEAAIEQALSDAAHFVSQRLWAGRYESGVMYKAAHLLCMTPFGEHARLDAKDRTTYSVVFDEMKRALPVRMLTGGIC
jgi:hypothetical protein